MTFTFSLSQVHQFDIGGGRFELWVVSAAYDDVDFGIGTFQFLNQDVDLICETSEILSHA